jgi:hypothetical protein
MLRRGPTAASVNTAAKAQTQQNQFCREPNAEDIRIAFP